MGFGCVLVHRGRRLRATIPLLVVEIPSIHGVLAERALEGYRTVRPPRSVVAHNFIVGPVGYVPSWQELLTFRVSRTPKRTLSVR